MIATRLTYTKIQDNKKIAKKPKIITYFIASSNESKTTSAHETIEQFFLINDSNTICTELPVFINPDEIDIINLDSPLTGHIDLVQIRYDKLYILDYKPNLRHPEQFGSQLLLYQKAIQKRTSIPEKNIIPAVFNQHHYFEFI